MRMFKQPQGIGVCLLGLSGGEQSLTAQQVSLGVVVFKRYCLCKHGHGVGCVAVPYARPGVQECSLGVVRVDKYGFLARFAHGRVVFHHVADVCHAYVHLYVVGLGFSYFQQVVVSLWQHVCTYHCLRHIVAYLEVFLHLQCVCEALYGVVVLSGAQRAYSVIFQHVKILLFFRLFLVFGFLFLSAEQCLKEIHW